MKVRIKKLNEAAVVPSYSQEGDAGLDLTIISKNVYPDYTQYRTGLAIEIPQGHVGLIFPRSSISDKDLILSNHVGVIDSGYRGEISFRFKRVEKNNGKHRDYDIGERCGQLVILPYPRIEFTVVDDLTETERGTGGFGSTDTKAAIIKDKSVNEQKK